MIRIGHVKSINQRKIKCMTGDDRCMALCKKKKKTSRKLNANELILHAILRVSVSPLRVYKHVRMELICFTCGLAFF